ncbi:DUF6922 domain-containing protein [Sediminibacterium ginsengisoli]|uniref:DUF6922 domain-containing protein n=1 Tax=Sediminibacterium ginsengisoli TaxID=413434 RepID=A0A1T4NYH7_9BACT|nr:hypothetical protein [Sediminibacterium ginsengisoli]SJZ84334.1 hypothetical protein SAMN04488132_10559 [Sediminibacterium ginsengisoli]
MNKAIRITDCFPRQMFWDVRMDQLDAWRDQAFIIPRALLFCNDRTFTENIERLEKIYSQSDIIRNLQTTKVRVSNQVCEWVARRYSIPVFHRFVS